MRPRRVIITIEAETDIPIKKIKKWVMWTVYHQTTHKCEYVPKQVQVNVVKEKND